MKHKQREIICISCPMGCRLTVSWTEPPGTETITVKGNKCPKGEEYGREEILAPKRIVTATCAVDSRLIARAPVRTDAPLPKELITELLEEAYSLELKLPVLSGKVLIEDFRGSGVNLIAGRTIEI